MSRSSKPTSRAERVWERLGQWYGARFQEQHGTHPGADWCEVIDDHSDDDVKRALSTIRATHVQHPPTFPEFDAIFAKVSRRTIDTSAPSMQSQLAAFVLKHRSLTPMQLRSAWTYRYRAYHDGSGKAQAHVITAVDIPADGDRAGLRVTVEDMQLEQAA